MRRILVTGSADGLGLMAARLLISEGHAVVLHGRNEARAADALAGAPGAAGALSGNLASLAQTDALAEQANADGRRPGNGAQAYADSKLLDVVLAFAVARRWPDVRANAVDPGWVATKMGGAGAPDDLEEGARTQAWLAAGTDPAADVTGRYLFHREEAASHPATTDPATQDGLLAACAELTGAALPGAP